MLLKTETYNQQSNFAQYCRDGKEVALNGIIAERLPHYRRLIFNIVKDAMETTFPIAFKYIESEIWYEMIYNFFSRHKCSDPHVWRMPKEFVDFCKTENYLTKYNLPYLNNLLYGYKVGEYKHKLQKENDDVNTCGRHDVVRAVFHFLSNEEYYNRVIAPIIKQKLVKNPDVFVSLMTAFLGCESDVGDEKVMNFFRQ